MRIVVTGSSGLIGTALVRSLRGDGHDVVRLVRHPPKDTDERQWDPAHRSLDPGLVDGADAVVHLAGAGVGDKRWSDDYKKLILDSRVEGTTAVSNAMAAAATTPPVLVSASAVGFYGERGDEVLDETAPSGEGFLADVVRQWEAATTPASDAGARVVNVRTGLVLSGDGGVLGRTLPLFKLGVGGKLGSGRQWMPWITLADEVRAIRHAIEDPTLSGAVNLSAPEPVRNAEYTKALGRALHRPTLATVPRIGLQVALGDFADEGALVSQRAVPTRLLESGFEFDYVDIDAALHAVV